MATIYMFRKNRLATSNLKCNSGVLSVYKLKPSTIIRIRMKAKDYNCLHNWFGYNCQTNIWLNNWVFASEYCIKLEFHNESNCLRKDYLANEQQYNTANGWIIFCFNGQSCQTIFSSTLESIFCLKRRKTFLFTYANNVFPQQTNILRQLGKFGWNLAQRGKFSVQGTNNVLLRFIATGRG